MIPLLWAVLLRIPLIARVILFHILKWTEQSKYVDLRTEVTVSVIRSFIMPSRPETITATQKRLTRDPGIKGRMWISKYAAPAPAPGDTSIRDVVVRAIEGLWPAGEPTAAVRLPDILPVEAEWTGYRAGVGAKARLPDISEREKYDEMMSEIKTKVTVLYFHGGAYVVMDPATHRATTKKLARLTGGRCYSVRYRLAPQHPFPAALIDALASYLTLLYPPPGAFHEAVPPEHIVFAGDSAGGNLSIALTQLILELNRKSIKVGWHKQAPRAVPLPAGVATNSPWLDMVRISPSLRANAAFDYLPAQNATDRRRAPCAAWPASPPRKAMYADDALLAHPLVSPLTAQAWAGAPPFYVCTGWELLADEDRYFAAKLARERVPVTFEEYEAMPHCFALVCSHLAVARRCMASWAGFIRRAVEDPDDIETRFTCVRARSGEEVAMEPEGVSPYSEEEMRRWVREKSCVGAEEAEKEVEMDDEAVASRL